MWKSRFNWDVCTGTESFPYLHRKCDIPVRKTGDFLTQTDFIGCSIESNTKMEWYTYKNGEVRSFRILLTTKVYFFFFWEIFKSFAIFVNKTNFHLLRRCRVTFIGRMHLIHEGNIFLRQTLKLRNILSHVWTILIHIKTIIANFWHYLYFSQFKIVCGNLFKFVS